MTYFQIHEIIVEIQFLRESRPIRIIISRGMGQHWIRKFTRKRNTFYIRESFIDISVFRQRLFRRNYGTTTLSLPMILTYIVSMQNKGACAWRCYDPVEILKRKEILNWHNVRAREFIEMLNAADSLKGLLMILMALPIQFQCCKFCLRTLFNESNANIRTS